MIDRIAVRRGDRALLNGADDPCGRGAREPEWVADRDDGIPDLHGARVAELERGQTPGLASTRSTAMSVEGSLPTSVARIVSRFEKLTSIWSAPSITW